jgi:hypothetical protein
VRRPLPALGVVAALAASARAGRQFVAQEEDFHCLAAAHDAVCEFVIGAAGLGLTDDQVRALQASDPRCK